MPTTTTDSDFIREVIDYPQTGGFRVSRSRPSFNNIGGSPRQFSFSEDGPENEEGEVNYMPNTVSHTFNMNVDQTSVVPHPFVVGTHRVGVEIELENVRSAMPRSLLWQDKDDGSLRNSGHEYVFRQPLGGRDLLTALQEVDTYLHDKNADASWRCSTHVHLDVRDMTATQIKFLLIAYTIYERLIFRCSGWHRFKNNFCPSFSFAQGQVMCLSKNWELNGSDFLRTMANSWQKYSCLNLIPMKTQGSVEFRMSEAKKSKGLLLRLCNRLLALKELAISWGGNEDDLISYLLSIDPIEVFTHKGLPKGFVPCYDEQLLGAKLATDMIHHHHIKNKAILKQGEVIIDISQTVPQWNDLCQCAQNYNLEIDGINFSTRSNSPTSVTYNQLYQMSSQLPMNLSWFIQSLDVMSSFDEYRRTRNSSN
jgi:hypothetical protein